MSKTKNTRMSVPDKHWQSRSNQRALKAHLNWKLCWQTSWAQKGAGGTTEPLNWWYYSRSGPVFPGSCIPRCSRGLVSLREVSFVIPHSERNSGTSVNPHLGLAVWGRVWTPSQTPQLGTWEAQRLLCHSLRLETTVESKQGGGEQIFWASEANLSLLYASQPHQNTKSPKHCQFCLWK